MEYGRYVCDRWRLFDGAAQSIRQSVGIDNRAAYAASIAGAQFASDRRYNPHPMTATKAPAPAKERTEFPLDSLLRRTYHFRRTMRILLMRVEDAGGSGTREGCKLAVLLNRTYIDASDCYWRLRRQLDAIPLPF